MGKVVLDPRRAVPLKASDVGLAAQEFAACRTADDRGQGQADERRVRQKDEAAAAATAAGRPRNPKVGVGPQPGPDSDNARRHIY